MVHVNPVQPLATPVDMSFSHSTSDQMQDGGWHPNCAKLEFLLNLPIRNAPTITKSTSKV